MTENAPQSSAPQSSKEWKLIEKLLQKSLSEQSRSRRWGIFFKLLTFAYLLGLLWVFNPSSWNLNLEEAGEPHTAMVQVMGEIAEDATANANDIGEGLRRAFEAKNAKAVLLNINSPGGSPVQSHMVYKEIRRLRQLHPDKKIYAAITDMGASGAYFIASAADEIYADPSSIVGSIGVISPGFGFTGLMEKLGIERRIVSAGKDKAMLDPFSPVNPEEAEHFQLLLKDVHQQFMQAVKQGRGARLVDDPQIFSGLFWTGAGAQQLGLIDGLASPGQVAREIVQAEKIVDYTTQADPFDQLVSRFGASLSSGAVSAVLKWAARWQ
jgi:protease-4